MQQLLESFLYFVALWSTTLTIALTAAGLFLIFQKQARWFATRCKTLFQNLCMPHQDATYALESSYDSLLDTKEEDVNDKKEEDDDKKEKEEDDDNRKEEDDDNKKGKEEEDDNKKENEDLVDESDLDPYDEYREELEQNDNSKVYWTDARIERQGQRINQIYARLLKSGPSALRNRRRRSLFNSFRK